MRGNCRGKKMGNGKGQEMFCDSLQTAWKRMEEERV